MSQSCQEIKTEQQAFSLLRLDDGGGDEKCVAPLSYVWQIVPLTTSKKLLFWRDSENSVRMRKDFFKNIILDRKIQFLTLISAWMDDSFFS